MYNRIELIGRLGKNAEMKHLPTGAAVTNFSLATTETWKNKKGEKQESTQWFNVQIWEKLAEALTPYLEKGTLVFVAGSMKSREYQNKDGAKAWAWEVTAREIKLLGGGKARHTGKSGEDPQGGQGQDPEQSEEPEQEQGDEPMPF